MKAKNSNNLVLFLLGIVALAVLLNLVSLKGFFRVDLTQDAKYTLSEASIETVRRLKDVMTVSAYFTGSLPPPYAQHSRYVNDLLEEYLAASTGKFAFEFLDPAGSETEEDKAKKKDVGRDIFGRLVREPTSVEKELSDLGLEPVEIRVIEDDEQQTKRAYMGLVIRYQDKHEVIPVVQDLADLERNMTSLMRKLVIEHRPQVGLIRDPSGPSIERVREAWAQNVDLKEVDLKVEGEIADELAAILVIGSGDHFGEQGALKIDRFLKKGKSATFALDRLNVDPRSFQHQMIGALSPTHKLFDLLKDYGLEIGSNLVADAACASLNMQENRAGFAFSLPVKYPFIPELLNLSFESPVTKGLTGVILPFASAIKIGEKPRLTTQILAKSSKVSWQEKEPFNLDPRRNWGEANIVPDGPHALMVEARGTLAEAPANKDGKSPETRLLVLGTSSFLWDDFLSGPNQVMALNMVDWMLADGALLAMRARTFTDAPLNAEISDGLRQAVKYGNILGVPLMLIIYGLVRWRMREARRRELKIS